MSGKKRARRLFLVGLVLWPLLHMALSHSGQFSPWRFGGWGMYATPYPSSTQHPISVLVDFAESGCHDQPSRAVAVSVGATDASRWLEEHAGLRFFVRCDTFTAGAIQLGQGDVLSHLADVAKAARQLERSKYLDVMAQLIEARLISFARAPHRLYLSIGELRANPFTEKYGLDHQVFTYTGQHLAPYPAVAAATLGQ